MLFRSTRVYWRTKTLCEISQLFAAAKREHWRLQSKDDAKDHTDGGQSVGLAYTQGENGTSAGGYPEHGPGRLRAARNPGLKCFQRDQKGHQAEREDRKIEQQDFDQGPGGEPVRCEGVYVALAVPSQKLVVAGILPFAVELFDPRSKVGQGQSGRAA